MVDDRLLLSRSRSLQQILARAESFGKRRFLQDDDVIVGSPLSQALAGEEAKGGNDDRESDVPHKLSDAFPYGTVSQFSSLQLLRYDDI
jgi:hypothetical protein